MEETSDEDTVLVNKSKAITGDGQQQKSLDITKEDDKSTHFHLSLR